MSEQLAQAIKNIMAGGDIPNEVNDKMAFALLVEVYRKVDIMDERVKRVENRDKRFGVVVGFFSMVISAIVTATGLALAAWLGM